MLTNAPPLLCCDLAVCPLGPDFPFSTFLGQFLLLKFRAYAACLPSLVPLLVALLEGSVIDQAGSDPAGLWESLDVERIWRSLRVRVVLGRKDLEAVDIGKYFLKSPWNRRGGGDNARIRSGKDNPSSR